MAGADAREGICIEVARILSEERRRRGLSMNELSARSGLSRAMISGLESSAGNPTLQSLLRIAEALELDLGRVIQNAAATATRGRAARIQPRGPRADRQKPV